MRAVGAPLALVGVLMASACGEVETSATMPTGDLDPGPGVPCIVPTPLQSFVKPGGSIQLRAFYMAPDGEQVPGIPITWAAPGPASERLTLTPDGLATSTSSLGFSTEVLARAKDVEAIAGLDSFAPAFRVLIDQILRAGTDHAACPAALYGTVDIRLKVYAPPETQGVDQVTLSFTHDGTVTAVATHDVRLGPRDSAIVVLPGIRVSALDSLVGADGTGALVPSARLSLQQEVLVAGSALPVGLKR